MDLLVFLKNETRHTRSCLDTLLRRLDIIEALLSKGPYVVDDEPISLGQRAWLEEHEWLRELEVSTRLYTALRTSVRGPEHFRQLVESGDFAKLPNVGKVTVAEAQRLLANSRLGIPRS